MTLIKIDMDKRCAECGEHGAMPSGLCMSCVARALDEPMRSPTGRLEQERMRTNYLSVYGRRRSA